MDGNISNWNKGAEELLNYPASEIIGSPIHKIYPKMSRYGITQGDLISKMAKTDFNEFEVTMKKSNGDIIHVQTSLFLLSGSGRCYTPLGIQEGM